MARGDFSLARPLMQTLVEAENLCRSEANRWLRSDPRTSEHWLAVADDLLSLRLKLVFDEARRNVQPLVDRILESENVDDIMDMRPDAGG